MSSPRSLVPLLVLAALLASGCGASSKKELLTAREANRLEATVNDADRLVDANRCDAARDAALKGSRQAQDLPKHVSTELQTNLVDGFEHLAQEIEDNCE